MARPTPEAYHHQALKDGGLSKNGYGEQFCWVAHDHQPGFVKAYLAWQDTAWLDWAVTFDDFLAGKMQTGPDGYKGWIGLSWRRLFSLAWATSVQNRAG